MIGNWFLRLGVLAALTGMGLGIVMGASHDHSLAPVHAHINLVGFVSMFLAGLFYKVVPAAEGKAAGLHLGLATTGLVLIAPGIAGAVLSKPWGEPVAIAGSLVTISAMLVFAAIVTAHTRRAPAASRIAMPATSALNG
ncbi:hypothetical protein [Prosthecomicrobium sp. N25]|uniref:hypothetical protein n=1 Tax=Prosthecomicrobium sp. N25 TaxID=3129254 RepID=UPI0030780734